MFSAEMEFRISTSRSPGWARRWGHLSWAGDFRWRRIVDPLKMTVGQYKAARGRAGSTGAFRSGLQAEDAISLVNPVAKTTGEREFALFA